MILCRQQLARNPGCHGPQTRHSESSKAAGQDKGAQPRPGPWLGFGGQTDVSMADLIMVGADLSGLCAARALIQQGKFLEARHRVGGRMVRKPVISGG
ncbi:hypothetical protein A8144_01325 [Mycobacterium leprae 3125609]|uniref:hypothetical protein n=1 Tax=Mycobacterium leprae TaxID=1769 RepID=UPI00059BF316|nr:hypothetical protein [Mycobacterium leprae]OAR21128.1 hypothetical protein A8144_01325 [Mycobacterium leprae 3125609]OAX72125.1 hypothetical protein A3216_01400 [Mycobacterium leprae 7935681]